MAEVPQLPWPVKPGRRRWVTVALWTGMATMIVVLAVRPGTWWFEVFATALIVAAAPQLYEGLASGEMRGFGGLDAAYSERPGAYVWIGLNYLTYTLLGIFLLYIQLTGGPRAV